MYIFKYILKISQPWELPTKNHHKTTRPSGRPKPGRCLWSSTNPRFLEHIASSLMQSFWFPSSTTQSRASRRNLASLKKNEENYGNDLVHWFYCVVGFCPFIPWNYKGIELWFCFFKLVICSDWLRYSPVGSKLDRHQPTSKNLTHCGKKVKWPS